MKRTARTALLAVVLIMSMSMLPAERVRADSGETTGAVREVEISGSGYIGAAPEEISDGGAEPGDGETPDDDSDGNPADSGKADGDNGSDQRKAAGFISPGTGDQQQMYMYLAALAFSGVVITSIIRKRRRADKVR